MADSVMPSPGPWGVEDLILGTTQQLMRKSQMDKKPLDVFSYSKILFDVFDEGIRTHGIDLIDFYITMNTTEAIDTDDSALRHLAKDEASNDNSIPEAESSQPLTQHSENLMRQCVCCMEIMGYFNMALAPCGHEYCHH